MGRSILVNWYLGTVGFGYKDWDGVFYPAGTPSRSYLYHYSTIFNSVEIDSTFYGTPPVDRVRRWAQAVPVGFKFCVKTPRQITHESRLEEADQVMLNFLESVRAFGEKLGAILIQFPPSLTIDRLDRVRGFLEALPSDLDYAAEFRHVSWYCDETADMLQTENVCWVSSEYLSLPKEINRTADFLYIRWLGRHGQFKHKNQERLERRSELASWQQLLQEHLSSTRTIYGFFNNDYSGHSPSTCNRFKQMIGLPIVTPQLPQQGKLF